MIERQAMADPRSSIVAHHGEAPEAKLFHDLDLILRHGAF
jgi:hypothetical protein